MKLKVKKPTKRMFEYWLDESETGEIIPLKMPYRYVIESFCDMLGASKAYNPDNWKPEMLLNYWETKCVGKRIMHPASMALVDLLINLLYRYGEEYFFEYLYPGYKDNLVALYEQGVDSDYETMRKLFGLTSKVG